MRYGRSRLLSRILATAASYARLVPERVDLVHEVDEAQLPIAGATISSSVVAASRETPAPACRI
jgi:hypothetical protein